jgi:hypothetical protein
MKCPYFSADSLKRRIDDSFLFWSVTVIIREQSQNVMEEPTASSKATPQR